MVVRGDDQNANRSGNRPVHRQQRVVGRLSLSGLCTHVKPWKNCRELRPMAVIPVNLSLSRVVEDIHWPFHWSAKIESLVQLSLHDNRKPIKADIELYKGQGMDF